MKIEKVNEQQIRCTLTREDLLNRELKISELAYGTEKAKSLFPRSDAAWHTNAVLKQRIFLL